MVVAKEAASNRDGVLGTKSGRCREANTVQERKEKTFLDHFCTYFLNESHKFNPHLWEKMIWLLFY